MNRTLLITGGSGKIGRVLVAYFLDKGDRVIFTGRSEDSLAAVREVHKSHGGHLHGFVADFTTEDAVESLVSRLRESRLPVEGLVNSARCLGFLKTGKDEMVARADFLGEYLVDVVAPYELTMALALAEESRLRYVVNIGSQYGSVAANPALYAGGAGRSPIHYGVAKAALAHLTRELAVRLADREVQVNCIALGGVEGRVDEAFKRRYAALAPMRRMLREDEIPGAVEFLLSEACSGMTGQVLGVDGGWTLW